MDIWDEGYTIHWRFMKVNPDTWEDETRLDGVRSISIERDATDDVPLLESSSLSIVVDAGSEFEDGWYRTEALVIDSTGGFSRWPIATMLYEAGEIETDKGYDEISISGFSSLQTASDKKMNAGRWVPKGADGGRYVKELLEENFPGPVYVSGSFTVNDYFVFQSGTTYLQAAWYLLKAAGWCMQINGRGEITILKKPSVPKFQLDFANARLLEPGSKRLFDLSGVPNRYYAVSANEEAVAENREIGSRVSYQKRGRWIEIVDTSPAPVNGENLQAYANRRLAEESTVVKSYSYTRRFVPDIYPFDMVTGSLNSLGLEGDLRILSQSIKCGNSISVVEKSGLEIPLWQAT